MTAEPTTAPQEPAPKTEEPILRVEGLVKYFPITRGIMFKKQIGDVKAVDGLN